MSGVHVHALHHHGDSAVHRMAPHLKVVAAFLFVVAVVLTPREQIWAFGVHLALLASVAWLSRLPVRFLAVRMLVLLPFLVAAWTLPFIGSEPVNGLGLSIDGLWAAWNITAKAGLGTLASVLLAATTEIPDLVAGLERLRAPRMVTAIMGFMARYLETVVDDMARMRVAMRSRGHRPRWIGAAGAIGRSIGALFVRTFERGERVYLAMVSRGYDGSLPAGPAARATGVASAVVAAFVVTAASVSIMARMAT